MWDLKPDAVLPPQKVTILKISLLRRMFPNRECHQCLALHHPGTKRGRAGDAHTSCQGLSGPHRRCYPSGQMLHSLGNTAALRGTKATEQPKLPINRGEGCFLLEQLQQLTSRLPAPDESPLERDAPTALSLTKTWCMPGNIPSAGRKVWGAQLWQPGRSSPQDRVLWHLFKDLKQRS